MFSCYKLDLNNTLAMKEICNLNHQNYVLETGIKFNNILYHFPFKDKFASSDFFNNSIKQNSKKHQIKI